VLVQTFSATGLGYLCTRAKFIDPSKGDMGALHFYVAWIGLPLLVFDKIAIADLAELCWRAILACNLAKIIVFIVMFFMTFTAYKSQRSSGQRLLTATIFAFFTTASNDLAIGFPVMKALYGPPMEVYLSANVFVYQSVFIPLLMVLLELGAAWRNMEEGTGSESGGIRRLLRKAGQRVVQNVVVIAALLGLVYQVLLGCHGWLASTVEISDGVGHLPPLIEDIVSLWTAPFTFLFLLINGTSLGEVTLNFWSGMLVLMKVVVCAYLTFFLGCTMLPSDKDALRNFTFFYGSIPTGGAPLVFAAIYDPACVGIIASATFYCLLLAGPVELMTALFLHRGGLVMTEVQEVQQSMATASVAACGVLLLLLLLTRRQAAAPSWVIACYAAAVFLYDSVTVLMRRMDGACDHFLWRKLYGMLQMVCCLLVLYMQTRLCLGQRTQQQHLLIVVAISLALALALPYFNTLDDLCKGDPSDVPVLGLSLLLACNLAILFVSCGLTAHAVVLKRRERSQLVCPEGCVGLTDLTESPARSSVSEAWSPGRRSADAGGCVAVAFTTLQAVRLLMEVLNLLIKLVGNMRSDLMGFTPMFMLVNVLEHGQGVLLLLVTLFTSELLTSLQARIRSCGLRPSSLELPDSTCA